jgi:chromosome segregation ATPase
MTRTRKVLGVFFVAVLGAYGCARGPAGSPGGGDRVAQVEAKLQRLEEDFRAAAAARDAFRQRLTAAEQKLAAAQRQLDEAVAAAAQDRQDRDAARAEAKAAAAERDAAQAQFTAFRKNVRDLLGQAEAVSAPAAPTLTVVPIPTVNAADRN